MDPDQKLLSVEFAANSIEFQATGKFPSLSRRTLLDKYNLFVLPGTAKIRRNDQDHIQHKSRFYTYQELRRIALADSVSNEDREFVEFYERAKTGGTGPTDFIVEGFDKLKVPLRLHD